MCSCKCVLSCVVLVFIGVCVHTLQLLCSHLVPLQDSKNRRLLCARAIFSSCNLKGKKKKAAGIKTFIFLKVLLRKDTVYMYFVCVCEWTNCSSFVLRRSTLHRQHHIIINSFELLGFEFKRPIFKLIEQPKN